MRFRKFNFWNYQMEKEEQEVQIEALSSLDRNCFIEEYVKKNRPVIVELDKVMGDEWANKIKQNWGTLQKWCENDIGKETVTVGVDLYNNKIVNNNQLMNCALSEYINNVLVHNNKSLVRDKLTLLEDQDNIKTYLQDFNFCKTVSGVKFLLDLWWDSHTKKVVIPEFLEDWITERGLNSKFFDKNNFEPFAYLFIGPAGAESLLHTDDHTTHGWLLQIIGEKEFLLWSPSQFPYGKHKPKSIILKPFQMLYVPFRWGHHVICKTSSVSLQWRHKCVECKDWGLVTNEKSGVGWFSNWWS